MAEPGLELVEIVDAGGQVVRLATRSEMRKHNLAHRSTCVVVQRSNGDVVVHKRAGWKDVWPGRWDIGFGGVAGVGESWEEAARRELAEEAGLFVEELTQIGQETSFQDDSVSMVGRAYLVVSDTVLTCPDGEVEQLEEVPVSGLVRWMVGRSVCPDFVPLIVPLLVALSNV